MMRHKFLLTAAALALLVTGCRDGNGGGGTGPITVVTPPPAPPPPPPPPPPPTSNTSLATLVVSQSFPNIGATMAIASVNRQLVSNRSVVATDPAPITLAYDASTQSYTIQAGGLSETVGPGELVSVSGLDPQGKPLNRSYQVGPNDILLLGRSIGDTSAPGYWGLTYVGYGRWGVANSDPFQEIEFVYGIPTDPADLPTTGSWSYRTDGFGTGADDFKATFNGHLDLVVDFAAGTVSAFASTITFPHLAQGTGSIDRSTGTFSFPLTGPDYSGTVQGRFFGPGALEIGATYTLRNATGDAQIGASAGLKSP